MANWEKLCPTQDIPPQERKLFSLGVWNVIVFNTGKRFLAASAECPHLGVSLEKGELHGNVIRCSAHGYQMDLTSGKCLTEAELSLPVFLTEIRDGWVWIKI